MHEYDMIYNIDIKYTYILHHVSIYGPASVVPPPPDQVWSMNLTPRPPRKGLTYHCPPPEAVQTLHPLPPIPLGGGP